MRPPARSTADASERVMAVIGSIATKHGVTVGEILSRRQTRKVARARWEAAYVLRHTPGPNGRYPSYPQLGRWFGRDHTSVIHGVRLWGETLG